MSPQRPCADRVEWFFRELARAREDALVHLPAVFSEDVLFRDPFRETHGLNELRPLFTRLFRQYPVVGFDCFELTGGGDAFTLTYEMRLRMAIGPEFVTPMASICRVRDDRVHDLRDYYDFAGSLVSPVMLLQRAYQSVVRAGFL